MKNGKLLTGKYKKALIAVCTIGLVSLMLLMIPVAMKNREYIYSIDQTLLLSGDTTVALCENLELPVGIYSVKVNYQTSADFEYTVQLTDESLSPLRVMQNPQSLAAAHTSEVFHLWLLSRSDNLTLFANGDSEQEVYFDGIQIMETNQVWYCLMLAVLILCFFAAVCILCAAYHSVQRIPASSFFIAALLLLLTVLLSRPYLMNWISLTGDVGYHLERIDGVARSILNGVIPMRLESNFPFGYGYADGLLYGSTLLYIPAILWLIGLPVLYMFNLFMILINLATILVSFYCFYKIFNDKYIGLLCSALYSFSLYRITVLFGRGCVGEGCAQIFMPLLIYGYYRLFTGDIREKTYKNTWLILLIGYSGILQSHTLSCELALIWTFVVCLINVRKIFRKETFLVLLKGAGLSILCNAWYAIPFLDYYLSENLLIKNLGKQTIQHQGITMELVFTHFFDGVLTDEIGLPIRAVGPGLIPMLALLAFAGVAIFAIIKKKKSKQLSTAIVCAVLSGVCIAFSLKIFPWDWIQQMNPLAERIVSSFLIPTRFLNWGTLFMVPVFGYLLWYAKKESKRKKITYAIGVAAVILSVGTSSMYYIYQITHTYERVRVFDNNQIVGYISGGEYIVYGTDVTKLSYGTPEVSENVQMLSYEKGDLSAEFRCVNKSASKEGYIEVPLFLYKGYHAYSGSGEELECVYGKNNVIRVLIPAGFDDTVSVKFISPVLWRISEAVSAAAWLWIVIYEVSLLRKKETELSCDKFVNEFG